MTLDEFRAQFFAGEIYDEENDVSYDDRYNALYVLVTEYLCGGWNK